MIYPSTLTLRLLRNMLIALIVALTITLAPIVRADTVRFAQALFSAHQPPALVKADLTH